jgi:hypothetical protein
MEGVNCDRRYNAHHDEREQSYWLSYTFDLGVMIVVFRKGGRCEVILKKGGICASTVNDIVAL